MASRKFKVIYVAQIILALDSAGLEHKLCMREKKDEMSTEIEKEDALEQVRK